MNRLIFVCIIQLFLEIFVRELKNNEDTFNLTVISSYDWLLKWSLETVSTIFNRDMKYGIGHVCKTNHSRHSVSFYLT